MAPLSPPLFPFFRPPLHTFTPQVSESVPSICVRIFRYSPSSPSPCPPTTCPFSSFPYLVLVYVPPHVHVHCIIVGSVFFTEDMRLKALRFFDEMIVSGQGMSMR